MMAIASSSVSDIQVFPKSWSLRRLADIADISAGGTPSREQASYWNGTIPWVTTSQIDFNEIATVEEFITEAGLRNSAARLLPPGTLLMALYGQGRTRGKVAVLTMWAATNQACASISVLPGVSPDFVRYFLTSRYEAIRGLSNAGGQENLNAGIVRNLQIALPPLAEQRAIASALCDVDALIGALDSLIAKKRALKQTAMQQLLTGRVRLPGFVGDWHSQRLRQLVIDGPSSGYSGVTADGGSGTPTLKLSATSSGGLILNYETVKRLRETIPTGSSLFLRPGDLLLQRSNTPDIVGTAAIFDGPSETYVYPDLMMRLRFDDLSVAEWVWRYANTRHGREYLLRRAAGSSGSMVKISGDAVRSMVIPLPSPAERIAIAAVLRDMDAEIAALEARRDKTRLLKQGMMQELLTGRVRLV